MFASRRRFSGRAALTLGLTLLLSCGAEQDRPPGADAASTPGPLTGPAALAHTAAGDGFQPTPDQLKEGRGLPVPAEMALVGRGTYVPLYTGKVSRPEIVEPFLMDRLAVTNAEFAQFTRTHPVWRPGAPPAIKAGPGYLHHWRGQTGEAIANKKPVTNVSWFAARAYCQSRGKRLPTIAEWERAAMAPDAARPNEGETALVKRILEWYGRPNSLKPVGSVYRNTFGLYDLHGSVWEWTLDFNSVTIDPDGRERGKSELFCGGGGFNASNPRDYAAFMRQAMRGGLAASSATNNLGFRCARDL